MLAEVFENFRRDMYDDYRLEPAHMITGPSLALASAMYNAVRFNNEYPEKNMPTEYKLIHDPEVLILFED